MAKKKTKKIVKIPKRKNPYIKPVVRKKHEAGWMSLIKMGIIAAIIYVVLAFSFGYAAEMAVTKLIINAIQVSLLIIMLIIFIVGLIHVSENTIGEIKGN